MHIACMATKTISITVDAWNRLRQARRRPGESFSQVILRAAWQEPSVTAATLLEHIRRRPPLLSPGELDEMEAAMAADRPPPDKWTSD